MSQRLAAIRERFLGRAYFAACDVDRDENLAFCRELKIVNIPWVIVFVAGVPTRRIVGTPTSEWLAEAIEAGISGRLPEVVARDIARDSGWRGWLIRWWSGR